MGSLAAGRIAESDWSSVSRHHLFISNIYFQLAPHGGIRPVPRRRSRLALTLSEREEISRGIAAAQSARSMARLPGRSASTVSRELSRNGGYDRRCNNHFIDVEVPFGDPSLVLTTPVARARNAPQQIRSVMTRVQVEIRFRRGAQTAKQLRPHSMMTLATSANWCSHHLKFNAPRTKVTECSKLVR